MTLGLDSTEKRRGVWSKRPGCLGNRRVCRYIDSICARPGTSRLALTNADIAIVSTTSSESDVPRVRQLYRTCLQAWQAQTSGACRKRQAQRIDELEVKQADPRVAAWAKDLRSDRRPMKLRKGAYGTVWTKWSEPHKARGVDYSLQHVCSDTARRPVAGEEQDIDLDEIEKTAGPFGDRKNLHAHRGSCSGFACQVCIERLVSSLGETIASWSFTWYLRGYLL